MKRIWWSLVIAIIILISSCSGYQPFQPWNQKEVAFESAYLVSSYIDYTQTREVVRRGDRELNQALGEKPSNEDIARYFIATRLLHFGVACFLEHEERGQWLAFTLGMSTSTIYFNWRMGY